MSEPANLLTMFGEPWLALALLALGIALLEAERWWTRGRRRRGRRAGAPAYTLDGLAIVSAVLAVASAVALLIRGILAVAQLTGELLAWASIQARNHLGLLVTIVAVIALTAAGLALARGRLRRPRAAAEPLPRPKLSERVTAEIRATDDADAITPTAPRPLPQLPDQPAAAVAPAQPLDQSASAIPQIAPFAVPPPVHDLAGATATVVPIATAQAEEPTEALISLSMLGHNRRPYRPAAPHPQSFLPSAPDVDKRRPRLPLVLATLVLAGLSLGGFVFRQQIADWLPILQPTTGEATAATLSLATPDTAMTDAPTPVAPTPSLVTRHVKSDALNLRARPGTDQPVIAKLARGASVLLLDETVTVAGRTWVRVRAGEHEGWVSQDLLE